MAGTHVLAKLRNGGVHNQEGQRAQNFSSSAGQPPDMQSTYGMQVQLGRPAHTMCLVASLLLRMPIRPAQANGRQQVPQGCISAWRLTFSGLSSPSTGTFSMADRTFKPAAGKFMLKSTQLKTFKRECEGSRAPPAAMAAARGVSPVDDGWY